MRIIRGIYQRRLIHPPATLPVRPTTDLAKESLFNVLEYYLSIENILALDLFSGTGNIGYELVSRGASMVVAVEQNPHCARFIYSTAESLQMKQLKVVRSDVFGFLKRNTTLFDLVFADPPYDMKQIADLPDLVLRKEVLKPGGLFVLEHPGEFDFAQNEYFSEQRQYGKVNFSLFVFEP
jgi:16S rRNA (guanine(966)-N(2))-methyltransferase RsmD